MARSPDTTLASALDSFLRARWDLKPTTKRGYENAIRRFMRYHETLAELTAEHVNDYLATIADHRTMSRNDTIALRQLAQWATKAGIFARDPLESVVLPKGHGSRRKPLDDADVRQIIAAAAQSATGIRDKVIVVLGISTAMRPIELWQLRVEDIDLRGGWVNVRIETTKTDEGERTIPLEPQVAALLDSYINDHRPSAKPTGRLFLNAHGDELSRYGFMQIFARLSRRLEERGIDFSSYLMRHTGITNWVRRGVPAPIIQRLAGHKSFVTTQGYVGQLTREDLARVPKAFTETYGRIA